MPRKTQTIRYSKALTTPSKREEPRRSSAFKMPMNKPKGDSRISAFVDEGRADGESSLNLVRQYQEAECKHGRWTIVASGPTKEISRCTECGFIKTKAAKS